MSAIVIDDDGNELPIERCSCGRPMAFEETTRLGFAVWACHHCTTRRSLSVR
jgi:hypothetical protein